MITAKSVRIASTATAQHISEHVSVSRPSPVVKMLRGKAILEIKEKYAKAGAFILHSQYFMIVSIII